MLIQHHISGHLSDTTVNLILVATVAILLWILIIFAKRFATILLSQPQAIAKIEEGYAYFKGITQPLTEEVLVTPLSKIPCVWYRVTITEPKAESGGRSRNINVYLTQHSGFILKDETASCVVFPENETDVFIRSLTWKERNLDQYRQDLPMLNAPNHLLNKYTITEEYIIENEAIKVFGHLEKMAMNTEVVVDDLMQSQKAKQGLYPRLKSIYGKEVKIVRFSNIVNYPAAIITVKNKQFYANAIIKVCLVLLALMIFGSFLLQRV